MNQLVGLVATASPCLDPDAVSKISDYLSLQGIGLQFDPQCGEKGLSADQRAQCFLDSIFDDAISVIWSLRGGEGSADILPILLERDAEIAQLKPKVLLGFSDFTPILTYFNQRHHWPVIHGMSAVQLINGRVDQQTIDQTLAWIAGEQTELVVPNLRLLNKLQSDLTIESTVVGGNLSLLNISVADLSQIDTSGKVIVIEEVNEKPHVVARTLKYLSRIGFFEQARAVVFGDMVGIDDTEKQQAMNRQLQLFAQDCDIPVLCTDCFGHGRSNFPLDFSAISRLIIKDNQPSLVLSKR